MKPDFLNSIQDRVILGDGALGAYLYDCGISRQKNLDLLNIESPDTVFTAHEEYIRAGSQLIETNTFGANVFKLRTIGFGEKVRELNRAGADIARKAAGKNVYVAGSVGPTGLRFPLVDEDVSVDEITASYKQQCLGLMEGGVDVLILETFSSLEEILLALSAARECDATFPLVAQMVFPDGEMSPYGDHIVRCTHNLLEGGASIIGTNCGRGIHSAEKAILAMAEAAPEKTLLSAFPNAGVPEMVEGRTIFPAQPDHMAERAAQMIRGGVRLIGGCCGTTPAHIHRFKSILKIKPVHTRAGVQEKTSSFEHGGEKENKPGKFLKNLSQDKLPIIVELDPPTHLDIEDILTGAERLGAAGADAISIAENPLAILRAGNLGLATLIRQRTGLNTILHQTGRDLNALGLQARMMEAHLLGIESVLAVTGDAATGSDQPGVSGVFDLRSHGLINMLNGLNNGKNMAGKELKGETDFSIGAAFCFKENNPDMQIRRLEKKADLGARFTMTQPLFSKEAVFQMLEKTAHIDMLIFPGIFPLISLRNAEFLHNEVPGISVPAELRKKLAAYESVADQRRVALQYTAELIEAISPAIDGIYLISPLNKWDIVLEFVEKIRTAGHVGSGRVARLVSQ